MTISREIHAVLKIEECGLENRNDISHDAVRRYVASSSNFSELNSTTPSSSPLAAMMPATTAAPDEPIPLP